MELHRAALRFPLQQFNYVGIDGDGTAIPTLINSELENAYRPFSSDPYGCFDQKLTGKRKQRDPYLQFSGRLGYSQSCPAIAGLLQHCSRDIYNGQLPWR
jgi:hypothetical protein